MTAMNKEKRHITDTIWSKFMCNTSFSIFLMMENVWKAWWRVVGVCKCVCACFLWGKLFIIFLLLCLFSDLFFFADHPYFHVRGKQDWLWLTANVFLVLFCSLMLFLFQGLFLWTCCTCIRINMSEVQPIVGRRTTDWVVCCLCQSKS